jgi:type I restriction enzyme S subunit
MICVSDFEMDIIYKIIKEYAADCDVLAFGSRYKWTPKDSSDLDLAFAETNGTKLGLRRLGELSEAFAESDLPFKVDVIDYHRVSDSFRKIIDAGNERIYRGYSDRGRVGLKYKQVMLGELYNITSGLSKGKAFFGCGYPFLSFKTVYENYFIPDELLDLADTTPQERITCSIKAGDVFLTRTSENTDELGMSCVALKDYYNATFNGFTKRLRPKSGTEINPIFAGYWFRTRYFRELVKSMSVMTTRASLNNEMINRLIIPIPSIEKQNTIANSLFYLDNKIANNKKINHNLEQIAQAIFKSWFVDFEPFSNGDFIHSEMGDIPAGWRVGILDDVVDFSNGYAFKSKELLDEGDDDCYHVFKMGHIQKGGGFNPNGTKSWIKRKNCQLLHKFVLKRGDLLMCMTDMKGNVALLGHTALMTENDKYIVNQRVGLLRPKNVHGIDFPFLYILTNYIDFLENLRGRANSGVQVNLSTAEIKASKFIIAPDNVNKEFNDLVKPMFQAIMDNQRESANLSILRDILLPRLMLNEITMEAVTI